MGLEIDINCDMGESYGQFKIGNDAAIFSYITSCNIACGFHGGDPLHIEKTIKQALKHDLQIGAHPSYPDLQGFGRRPMQLVPEELKAIVKYQVAALKGMAESLGGHLSYVKPHGALYNSVADNIDEAHAVIEAIQELDNKLALMGLAESNIENVAYQKNIPFIKEAFADRKYNDQGRLISRNLKGSVLENPEDAANQVVALVKDKQIWSNTGKSIAIDAQTVCIHGDNPMAVDILKAIHSAATTNNIRIKKFSI